MVGPDPRYDRQTESQGSRRLFVTGQQKNGPRFCEQTGISRPPYHLAILVDRIHLSIGGGIGQSRTFMYLLRAAHFGEVTFSVWPKQLKEICAKKNIHVLE